MGSRIRVANPSYGFLGAWKGWAENFGKLYLISGEGWLYCLSFRAFVFEDYLHE